MKGNTRNQLEIVIMWVYNWGTYEDLVGGRYSFSRYYRILLVLVLPIDTQVYIHNSNLRLVSVTYLLM